MTTETFERATKLDVKRGYYASKLAEVEDMQKLVDNLRRDERDVICVSIGTAPRVTSYIDISLVEAMLLEADKFYMAKKLAIADEFAQL